VPSLAYDARFRVMGPRGERMVPAAEYFELPERNLREENVLAPDELLTHVELPPPASGSRSAKYEVRFKQSHAWPLAMASVALVMRGQRVSSARVVMGAVAPVPWRAEAAERVLTGKALTEALAAEAAAEAVRDAEPLSGNAYKVQIARTAVKRALLKAVGLRVV
jgi:xanthine dehydrogenase YagS FAD-binding subunit